MFKCLVNGCASEKHKAKGYCALHYDMVRRNGAPVARPYVRQEKECKVNGCMKFPKARGLCDKHLQRLYKKGDPLDAGRGREYGSGKDWHKNSSGYIVRYEPKNPNSGPNGQVYQHRHVMSEMIGRPLRDGENVHHVNGVKSDNRPENLELWISSQPSGQRVTDIVKWAISILADECMIDAATRLEPSLAGLLAEFLTADRRSF